MSNAEQTDTESQVTNKKQEGVRCCLLNIDYLKTKNGIFRIAIIVNLSFVKKNQVFK